MHDRCLRLNAAKPHFQTSFLTQQPDVLLKWKQRVFSTPKPISWPLLLFQLIQEDQQQDLLAHVHVCVLTPSLGCKDLKADFWAQGQKAGGV